MSFSHRLLLGTLFAFAASGTSVQTTAQELINQEARLKAGLVGLLGQRFVTWPAEVAPNERTPLTVGIIGSNPFVDDRGFNHLSARVSKIVDLDKANAGAIKSCHILVIARDANFKAAQAKASGRPILIVSESPGLANQGAMINLVVDQQKNKIRLEINPKTAFKAGLKIDSQLLNSALVDIVP